ncbi:hypothetical protein Vafri_19455, partial [Volvox africanus]
EGKGGDDVLGVHQRGVAQVVQTALLEDLSAGLEPHGLTELHAVLRQQLGGHAAQGAKHGPAGMDQLQLAVALEGLRVSRQAGSVPAVVAGELAGQVGRGGVLGVRAQPLGAVGAIPLDAAWGGLGSGLAGALLAGGLGGHLQSLAGEGHSEGHLY